MMMALPRFTSDRFTYRTLQAESVSSGIATELCPEINPNRMSGSPRN